MRISSEINLPLKAIATVISSMKKASKQTVSKKTWNQIIGLYPYLVQFTETNSPQIGKAVKDALLEYHDLLQPLLCPWFMNKFLLECNQKHQFSENLEIHSFRVLKKKHLALKPYPYLVQFTKTNCPQIGKAVNDALLEHHDLLQPLLCLYIILGLKIKFLKVFGQFPNYFYRLWKKKLNEPTAKIFFIIKKLKVLKTCKCLTFNP